MTLHRDYPHLAFKKQWHLDESTNILLGQCEAYVDAIANTPILPEYYRNLMEVALTKGAQATTAIEGNTLTEDEVKRVHQGQKLPESREYLGIEVKNILEAFTQVLNETVFQDKQQLIDDNLILRFHKMVGMGLGEHFAAIPGQFRKADVIVGPYKAPDYRDVPELAEQYCSFLKKEFRFEDGHQRYRDVIIQAIVAHIYLEWIHPFSDGNGRTGRLLEFYILSRGGYPDIVLHVLSNHYNQTRTEYYRQINAAYVARDLSEFIRYALTGFRDGAASVLQTIRQSQLRITWQHYIYSKFAGVEFKQKEVFKRKRNLALALPIDRKFRLEEIPDLNTKLARIYGGISELTLKRDLQELIQLQIVKERKGNYFCNIIVLYQMMATQKNKTAEFLGHLEGEDFLV
ncbi:MAG TPA: Fic family protein [Saprospiraceae bacterium]|nr:Fic family protein [Saprospiraceae bacterium]